jgi:hypothetical protein
MLEWEDYRRQLNSKPDHQGTFLDPPNEDDWKSDQENARGYYGESRGHSDRFFLYAIAWTSTAALSGIVGNVAYAAIYPLLKKMKRKDKKPVLLMEYPYDEDYAEYIDLIARLAVAKRCGDLNIPVPDLDKMRTISESHGSGISYVKVDAPNLHAEVLVAASIDIYTQSIPVAIWTID